MGAIRLLIADDHRIVAEGLASLLQDRYELVGIVGDGVALVEAAKQLRPDIIVADMAMPGMSGLDALRLLRAESHAPHMIFLTMVADAQVATEAFRAGAMGYLLKDTAGEELLTAIREVLQGRAYLTPLIAREVIASLLHAGALLGAEPPAEHGHQHAVGSAITPRQREVLALIAGGRTMKEIAAALGLSTRTVETHKYEMMRELGLQTTAELIQYAVRQGLGAPER